MPLTSAQKLKTMQQFTRQAYTAAQRKALVDTNEIEAALDALVRFIEDNTAAVNNVLPVRFNTVVPLEEKRHLLGLAAAKLAGFEVLFS